MIGKRRIEIIIEVKTLSFIIWYRQNIFPLVFLRHRKEFVCNGRNSLFTFEIIVRIVVFPIPICRHFPCNILSPFLVVPLNSCIQNLIPEFVVQPAQRSRRHIGIPQRQRIAPFFTGVRELLVQILEGLGQSFF